MPSSFHPARSAGISRTAGIWLLLAALLWISPAPVAYSAPVGGGWTRAAGIHAAEHFVGQYTDSRGQAAYCTDFERMSPEQSTGYDGGHTGAFVRSDGSALTAAENAALSYLLHRWGATADNATAASVQLAVWALTSPGMAWGSAGMDSILRTENLPADVVAKSRSMTETAFNGAGPYTVDISLEAPASDGTVTAVVGVLAANGEPAAGLAAAAALSGPFALAEGSAATWTSAGDRHRLSLQRTGLGGGSLKVTVPRTPAAGVTWLLPESSNVQRLLVAAVVEPRSAAAAITDLPAFQPAVTTRTSAARTDAGTAVHDVLSVSIAPPADGGSAAPAPWLSVPGSGIPVSLEVVSTLWGPLDAKPVLQDAVPEGTPSVGSVSTRVDGPGTYSTEGLVVPEPGWYVWTESIAAASAHPAEAADYVLDWQGKFGIVEETTFVPWAPGIRTELSAHEALVGEQVTDTVTGTGFGPFAAPVGGTVTLSMYGPLAAPPSLQESVPADAPLHSEVTVAAANGTLSSEPFAAFTLPGCYTVVATYPGDELSNPYASAFGEPSETVCVEAASSAESDSAAAAVPVPPTTPVAGAPVAGARVSHAPAARAELAQTGARLEVAAGAALVLLGTGLACLRRRV